MKIVVTGASGFVGNHVVSTLLDEGHTVIGLSRKAPSNERKIAGAVYIDGVDIADPASVKAGYFEGVDAVVHLVGIIMERRPGQTFQRIHVVGTRNVVSAASQAGVRRIVYMSAIGSAPDAEAEYSRTKYEAETIVKESGIPYVILRPSIILGRDGEFVAQMRDLVKYGGLPVKLPFPVVPVPGSGRNLFQPINIDDLMTCVTRAVIDPALIDCTIEVGGTEQVTFNDVIKAFACAEGVKKPILHAPMPLLALAAPLVERLPNPPFSSDQLKNLKRNNIADIGPMKQAFHFAPIGFHQAMKKIYPE